MSVALREMRVVEELLAPGDRASVTVVDTGWTSRVYLVDRGRLVVKFPRFDEVRLDYAREAAVLRLLEEAQLRLRAPRVRWVGPDHAYLGYEGVVGSTLDEALPGSDRSSWRAAGRWVGGFLSALHALVPTGPRLVTIDDEVAELQRAYARAAPLLEQELPVAEQAALGRLVRQELPRELEQLGHDPVLCHGDLGYTNLVACDDGEFGVIDFGDAGYYDRSMDFAGLTDPDVLDEALRVYGDDERLRRKTAARQRVVPLLELPHLAQRGDQTGLDRALGRLRSVTLG